MVSVAVVHGSKFNEEPNGLLEFMQGISSVVEFSMMPISQLKQAVLQKIDGYVFIDQASLFGLSSEFKAFFESLFAENKNLDSKAVTSFGEGVSAESELKNLTTSLGAIWVGLESKKIKAGAYEELGQKFAKITKALKMEQLA